MIHRYLENRFIIKYIKNCLKLIFLKLVSRNYNFIKIF